MKLGLISDVHGDLEALRQACEHLAHRQVDRIVCAGDLVGYGPDPDGVVAEMQRLEIPSVRGNHDRWALRRGPNTPDEFGGASPGPQTLEFLRTLGHQLLVEAGRRVAVVVHGSPSSDMEFVSRDTHPPEVLDGYLESLRCDLLVVGHTHRPMWYRSPRGGLVVNPGSIISRPVVETSRTFAVVDLDTFEPSFYDLEFGTGLTLEPWV